MKKVKMKVTVKDRKKNKSYDVTDRYADYLLKGKFAELAESKKEEKVKPETKEEKPKAETITKAVK